MASITTILSVAVLAIMLTSHCVFSMDYDGVNSDQVKLYASNGATYTKTIEGKLYPKGGVEKLSNPSCCLIFTENCYIVTSRNNCSCYVVYRGPECRGNLVSFYKAVVDSEANGVVFTTWNGYLERSQELYNLTNRNRLSIPVVLVEYDNSFEIWSQNDEANLSLIVEVDPSSDSTPGSGLDNTRSATTFYFVVFAFTILLLLSLTWFVFNYLRRCHHMYTLKRQRAELLSKTRRAIEKCPTKTYKKAKKTGQRTITRDDADSVTSEEEERCPICLETFKMKDVLRVLPCHHEFHKSCIDPWLYEKGTCPMCKLNIVGNQDECDSEQVSREIRMLTMPVSLELELLEEGLSTAESDHNNVNQQSNPDENLQVESIE